MAPRAFRQGRSSDQFIQLAIRLVLLAFLLYWSFVLVRPFIPILAWSMVLTVALYPAYNWLSIHLGNRPKLAALIITMINLAIIIGPVTWLGFGLIDGLQGFAAQLGEGSFAVPSPPEGIKDWPIVGAQLYALWDHASTNLRAALRELAPHLKPLAGPVLAFAVLILAILQIGSVIVILPVVIWIWATKEFTAALLLTIYLLIVSLADNVLKPMLMGRGLSTPMFVIFIGVMGGMLAHGIVGLFVGPIILAVAW